jgi:hypothetical protein
MTDQTQIEPIEPEVRQYAAPADPLLAVIERAARDPAVDVDKMERLFAMMERRELQASKQAFNAALARAKGEIPPIIKNRLVDFESQKGKTRYRYEDFAAVAEIVDPVLKANGLSYRFRSSQPERGRLQVTCVISHDNGFSEETSLESGEDTSGNKNPVQAIGSAATYLQRYTLKLALGLAATTDDDGRGGDKEDPVIDADQLALLEQLMVDAGRSREAIENWAGVKLPKMREKKYQETMSFLNMAVAKRTKAATS